MVKQVENIFNMKWFFILFILIFSVTNIVCQNNRLQENSQVVFADSILVSSIDAFFIHPIVSDRGIEKLKKTGEYCSFIYPLLILNNVIIREEKKVDCFRNSFEWVNIKKTKRISKVEAEKKGIPNVPKDGVLFVTTKKGYYFDFSCE